MQPPPAQVLSIPPEHPLLSRPICFCTRHKRYLAYALTFLSLFLSFSWPVWFALVAGAWSLFLVIQWKAFNTAIENYRRRDTIFVVYTDEAGVLAIAEKFCHDTEKILAKDSSKKCKVILQASKDFEPWLLLTGSYTLVFVTGTTPPSSLPSSSISSSSSSATATTEGDADAAASSSMTAAAPSSSPPSASYPDRFLLWLLAEKSTRLNSSALTGFNTNIVYTAEGKRRVAFQRINYAVIPCQHSATEAHTGDLATQSRESRIGKLGEEPAAPSLAQQIDGYLEAFGARRFCADPEVLLSASTVPSFKQDLPPFELFFTWALACPCCDQVTVERARHRPSPFRVPFWQQHLLLRTEPSMSGQLWRYYKQTVEGWWAMLKALELTMGRARIDFLVHDMPPPPPPPITLFAWECAFGDPELVEPVERDLTGWTLNPKYFLSDSVGQQSPMEVEFEFAANFHGPQLCVNHPITGALAVYQVTSEDDVRLLQGLATRSSIEDLSPTQKAWMVEAQLWVNPAEQQAEWERKQTQARNDLETKGWTLFSSCYLIPSPFLRALRRHYRRMESYLFDFVTGPPCQRSYNDEPVSRQIQQSLTPWVQRLTQQQLAHSSLALSIFIRPGPGFIFHTDTSPPFDITLDVAVDHEGPFTRPIYFTRPNPAGGLTPIAEKLELKFGEAVLFRGSELTHWGGDMGPNSQHKVILGTWQFIKD